MRAQFLFTFVVTLAGASVSAFGAHFCGLSCDPVKESISHAVNEMTTIGDLSTAVCGPSQNRPLFEKSPMIAGGRRAMALTYGGCEPLKQPIREKIQPKMISASFRQLSNGLEYAFDAVDSRNSQKVFSSHPYLAHLRSPECTNAGASGACSKNALTRPETGVTAECKKIVCDAVVNPPMYEYGGKAGRGEAVGHVSRNGLMASGVDCSFFVFQSMNRAGLRYYPVGSKNEKNNGYRSTAALAPLGEVDSSGKRLDCFDRVGGGTLGLEPGDLLVAGGIHVVMVDTVGKDPYGLDDLTANRPSWQTETIQKEWALKPEADRNAYLNQKAISLCADLDPEKFQITIIHSSPNGNNVGIQREKVWSATDAQSGLGHHSTLLGGLKNKARVDCIRTLRNRWAVFAPTLLKSSNSELAIAEKSSKGSPKVNVLRHAADDPACRMSPPVDPALDCANCCDLSSSYEQMVGGS